MLFPLRALDVMYIEMQVVIDVEHPTGALVGVINGEEGLNIDDMVQNAKQLINLRDWGYIYVAKNSKLRTYNADGTLKPVVEWEIPQYVYFNEFHLRKGTPHVQIAAPCDEYAYFCMFKITLVSGEVFFTDEIPIN